MGKNVGPTDKIIRLVLAVAAAIGAFVTGASSTVGIILLVVAVVLAVTAFVGFCPLYRIVGVNTCSTDRR
jgi:hypothetical protein